MPLYYCEVCFNIPLPQCFTYTYHPKPWQPLSQKKSNSKGKTRKNEDKNLDASINIEPIKVYPELGQKVRASFGRSQKEGWIISVSTEPPESLQQALAADKLNLNEIKEIEIAEPKPLFGNNELQLAQWMVQYYICGLGEALNCIVPTGKKEKEPLGNGTIADSTDWGRLLETPNQLSAEQKVAVSAVCCGKKAHQLYYLFGPTGSGKTEVFLQCMKHVLQQGKSVIYLVPEISLCYPLQEQLQRRFQQPVALLHSHLNTDQRLWYWRNIQQGHCHIVLGARSAVFAPVPELGLIILDEEHEPSYKAGDTPRYHTRQIAMRRCRDHQSILLMGSATPSVEAMYACAFLPELQNPSMLPPQSNMQILPLSQRLAGGSFPKIEMIDLRKSKTMISNTLLKEVETVTSHGGQAILFLNRRGYAPVVECFSCGKVQECSHCSVALTYHKNMQQLKCHHCGFSMTRTGNCHYCHQNQLELVGCGTEQIEEELQRCFGHLRIARLDTDVSRKKGQSQKILQEFQAGNFDLLVGTQMVAKGFNFPHVQLVGVIFADTSLNMPDFRAAERSFSLLVQVAGRAGRYRPDGKVLIQTYQPQSNVIRLAADLNWQAFYSQEIELRKLTLYPPFSRLIRLVFRGGNATKVQAEAQQWYRDLQHTIASFAQNTNDFTEVLPACECPYFRLANKYRYHLLLRCSHQNFTRVRNCVQKYFWQARSKRNNVYVEIDVDPNAMM